MGKGVRGTTSQAAGGGLTNRCLASTRLPIGPRPDEAAFCRSESYRWFQPCASATREATIQTRKSSALGSALKWSIQRATPKATAMPAATVDEASQMGGNRG